MKEDRISSELHSRVVELVKKTHEEIGKLVDDYVGVKISLGKPRPNYFEYLEVYDSTVISFISMLTERHLAERNLHIKKMAEREREK